MCCRVTKTLAVFFFIIWLAPLAFGQQSQGRVPVQESPYVDFAGFKGKIFELKHRDPREMKSLLEPLGSGFKGAIISANLEFKTLTVRDFPENIAAIEEAIKRLDVPTPRPARPIEPDVELHLHVLIASNVEGASNQYPAELKDVLKQLQATLNFKNYYLLTSIVQRAKLTASRLTSEGLATVGTPLFERSLNAQYSYGISQILRETGEGGAQSMYVRDFGFTLQGATNPDAATLGSARISTNLSLRDGEKVVVGTSSLKDKSLILVLSAKMIR